VNGVGGLGFSFVYILLSAIGLIWTSIGLGPLTETDLYNTSAFENSSINQGGYSLG